MKKIYHINQEKSILEFTRGPPLIELLEIDKQDKNNTLTQTLYIFIQNKQSARFFNTLI